MSVLGERDGAYHHVVVNDDLEKAYAELVQIVTPSLRVLRGGT